MSISFSSIKMRPIPATAMAFTAMVIIDLSRGICSSGLHLAKLSAVSLATCLDKRMSTSTRLQFFFPEPNHRTKTLGTGVHLQKVCLVKVWSRAPQFDLIKRSWHAEFPWGRVLYRNHLSSTGTVCIPTLIVPSVSRKVAIRQLPKIIPDRFHPSSSEKSAVPIELVNYVRG